MKIIKRIFAVLFLTIMLLIVAAYIFNFDYLIKAVRTIYLNGHTTAFLDDYQYFDNDTIKSGTGQPWKISKSYNKIKPSAALENLNNKIGTVAFLVIKNDSIITEVYYDGYDKNSKSNSFSMAKSVVSAALGKAIMERKIKSLDEPVGDFFPEFTQGKAAKLTVGDLSSMSSGSNWDESYYSPFSVTTRAYFDDDLAGVARNMKIVDRAGEKFKYQSGNTQLLAQVIEKATGTKLSDYVSENFWKPLGAENAALWQTDSKGGIVKAYCCIASNARDFARFGKLYKQHGKWNGIQILDSTFVATSIKPRFTSSPEYGYGWWLSNYLGKNIYYMRGHLGQYVIVIPEDDLIIVRLGERTLPRNENDPHSPDFYKFIDEAYKISNVPMK